jgi:hypothetical protein
MSTRCGDRRYVRVCVLGGGGGDTSHVGTDGPWAVFNVVDARCVFVFVSQCPTTTRAIVGPTLLTPVDSSRPAGRTRQMSHSTDRRFPPNSCSTPCSLAAVSFRVSSRGPRPIQSRLKHTTQTTFQHFQSKRKQRHDAACVAFLAGADGDTAKRNADTDTKRLFMYVEVNAGKGDTGGTAGTLRVQSAVPLAGSWTKLIALVRDPSSLVQGGVPVTKPVTFASCPTLVHVSCVDNDVAGSLLKTIKGVYAPPLLRNESWPEVRISHRTRSASLIAHTRPAKGLFSAHYPDCLLIHITRD